jgi:hypothetical protein
MKTSAMTIARHLSESQEIATKIPVLLQKRAKVAQERFAEQLQKAFNDNLSAVLTHPIYGEIQPRPFSCRRNQKLLTTMRYFDSCLVLVTDLPDMKTQPRKNHTMMEGHKK